MLPGWWLPEAELARAGGPGAPALGGSDAFGDADLLGAAGAGGRAGTAVGAPGPRRELEAAGVAVAGVDAPVAARLTLGQAVPDAARGGRRGRPGHGRAPGGGRSGRLLRGHDMGHGQGRQGTVLDLLALGGEDQLLPGVDEVRMLDLLVQVPDRPPAGQLGLLGEPAQGVALLDRDLLALLGALGGDDPGLTTLHGVDR